MEPTEEIVEKNPAPPAGKKENAKGSVFEFVKFALIAVVIVVPVRLFIAQPFVVSGASMVPSFQSGHYLIIDEISYRFEEPKRGEVIVFRFPFDTGKFLIKRVAGLPGETVSIKGDEVTITNKAHPEGFLWQQGEFNSSRKDAEQMMTLADDEYFVLGDNRDESADSRLWGKLKREFIVGRPLIRLFPFSQIGVFPGEWEQETE
ncbi:MAG: signal peptidase I [bacterium]|nr:signal peptidase I [bacterium]